MTLEELFLPNGSLTGKVKFLRWITTQQTIRAPSDKNMHFNKPQVMYVSKLVRSMHFKNFMYLCDRLQKPS